MADLLNIGLSGLNASKTQLSITGHNITNVNTPGYTRQDAMQATRTPQFTGAGYIGSGTTLVDVRRSYSEYLTQQLRSSTALNSDASSYQAQISQLDSLLASTSTGINPALQSFFSAMQTAAEDPANIPARQLVLAEADGLARRFNGLFDSLQQQNTALNKQMVMITDQVNRLASSIGGYNDAIAATSIGGTTPNDLLDARDEAIRQLSELVGVTVVAQDDNSFNLFVGSGQPLVVGAKVNRLEVVNGTADPTRSEIQFVSGSSRQNITTMITGGEMGGILRYRQEALDPSFNALGQLSLSLAEQINSQLGQGLDLAGQAGTALFGDINTDQAMRLRVQPFSGNASTAQPRLEITSAAQLTTSDYLLEYASDGTPRLTRLSDNTAMVLDPEGRVADAAGVDQGFQLQFPAPAPAANDKFLLQPTRRGAADITTTLKHPEQLAFAAPARASASVQNAGTGVIGQPELVAGAAVTSATLALGDDGMLTSVAGTLRRVDPSNGYADADPAEFQMGQLNTYELALEDGATLRFTLSGRPAVDDQFTLGPNQNGVSDNRNALKLVDLQSAQTLGLGSGTGMSFADGYGQLVERVGTQTAQARIDTEATGAILKQATDARDSLSAVNLDEEAANLIKFEQYYNASAQIIQVARSLFDTLISTFR
ncbi:flagellar hook-associated protein FlgK [Stutzerimonas tarimensis]|uniref:Flagellar hook-associated protein 1 n=1 Tax=Stutzerimonas tarimensis TaxID=1507735 RepID=A0ABV7T1C0_9GAMM